MATGKRTNWADLNYEDNETLAYAILRCDLPEIARLLAGGTVNPNWISEKHRMPHLSLAAYSGDLLAAQMLVEHGALVNMAAENGSTPLMIAAQKRHGQIVKYLLSCGANVNDVSKNGMTALMCASKKGYQDVVDLLLHSGADSHLKMKAGFTAKDFARVNGHYHLIQLFERTPGSRN